MRTAGHRLGQGQARAQSAGDECQEVRELALETSSVRIDTCAKEHLREQPAEGESGECERKGKAKQQDHGEEQDHHGRLQDQPGGGAQRDVCTLQFGADALIPFVGQQRADAHPRCLIGADTRGRVVLEDAADLRAIPDRLHGVPPGVPGRCDTEQGRQREEAGHHRCGGRRRWNGCGRRGHLDDRRRHGGRWGCGSGHFEGDRGERAGEGLRCRDHRPPARLRERLECSLLAW